MNNSFSGTPISDAARYFSAKKEKLRKFLEQQKDNSHQSKNDKQSNRQQNTQKPWGHL